MIFFLLFWLDMKMASFQIFDEFEKWNLLVKISLYFKEKKNI